MARVRLNDSEIKSCKVIGKQFSGKIIFSSLIGANDQMPRSYWAPKMYYLYLLWGLLIVQAIFDKRRNFFFETTSVSPPKNPMFNLEIEICRKNENYLGLASAVTKWPE